MNRRPRLKKPDGVRMSDQVRPDRLGMAVQLATNVARMSWYTGVNYLMRQESGKVAPPVAFNPTRPVPDRSELLDEVRKLLRADAEAVRDGIFPPGQDEFTGPVDYLRRLREMFRDLPDTTTRRTSRDWNSAREAAAAPEAPGFDLPDYYTQDFHYQTGGYLTEGSARLYDVQVETLFYGAASAMRRAGLRPIAEYVRGRDQRQLSLVDVACGTGRLLRDIRLAFPAMQLSGVDLSAAYLEEARRHMGRLRPVHLKHANAEALPFDTASQDIVVCVFLFHELPPDVRRVVTAEIARVLKPGGLFVFIDSLQMGDRPGWDGLLEAFPVRFHEPYYRSYAVDDLEALFSGAGLAPVSTDLAFLAKVMTRCKA